MVLFIIFFMVIVDVFGNNQQNHNKEKQVIDCQESVTNGIFKWKYNGNKYTASSPLCWQNDNENPIFRECNTTIGIWETLKGACTTNENVNTFCPEDLIEISGRDHKKLCLRILKTPQKYDERICYGSDSNILDLSENELHNTLQYLKNQNIHTFWLPINRENNKDSKHFAVRLPGKKWQEIYNVNLTLNDIFSDKNCLTLRYKESRHNDVDFNVEISSCKEKLHSVCVFQKRLVADAGCPQGFAALSYKPNECFGINWESGRFPEDQRQLSIAEYYQKRNSLRLIFDNLDSIPDYFEVHSFVDKHGDQYAVLLDEKEKVEVRYIAKEKNHALCTEVVVNRKTVEMIVKMDSDLEELVLVVYNRHYIWRVGNKEKDYGIKCFTNADYDEWSFVKISMIWENDEQTKSIFKLKLIGNGPGEYWCEAHTIFDFDMIKTNRVVASKKIRGHPFAMLFDMPCDDKSKESSCIDFLKNYKRFAEKTREILNDCTKLIRRKDLNHHFIIHNVRVMSVGSFSGSALRSFIHVMISDKNSAVDNSEEDSSEEDNSEESPHGIRHDTSVRMNLQNILIELVAKCQPLMAKSIRSTEFCFPESFKMQNGGDNKWLLARRGQVATTLKLCLKKDGIPNTRQCLGNFIKGAHWEVVKLQETSCANQDNLSNVTTTLYDLNRSKISINSAVKTVQDIKSLLMYNKKKLIPADLFYMARILKNSIKKIASSAAVESALAHLVKQIGSSTQVETLNEATYDIVKIYNYLMEVNEKTLRSAAVTLNSTNILLDAFETLIDKGSYIDHKKANDKSDSDFDFIVYTDTGVSLKSTANLLVYTIDPSVANVSGVAIFRDLNGTENMEALPEDSLTGAFQGEYYRFLHAELSIDEIVDMPNLQMATYFPRSLLNRLDEISAALNSSQSVNISIIIKIYSNDKLFQENENRVNNEVKGRIVSISIPGHGSDLTELLPLVLRVNRVNDYDNNDDNQINETKGNCAYWNYRTWASDGLMFLRHSEADPNVILCGCTHLTPFAYLIGGNMDLSVKTEDDVIVTQIHTKALDIITMVGCSLSILGILGTFITAATFQSWRQKASSKVLLQLSAAIALQMILLCFVNTKEHSIHLIENNIISSCIIIGALLHYSVLVQFCWMVVIAHLQFKRYVQVFGNARPKRFLIKSTLFAWGLPLAPAIIVALIDKDSFSEADICYPSGYALYFGVVFPITIIILINLITFVIVIYNILKGPDGRIRHTERRMVISQIRLSVLLFFLLGFTWIFGLMSAIKVGIVFSYLFCLTATLQGFVIFVYFIILDPITRRMWFGYFRRCFGIKTSLYESSSSTAKDTTTTTATM